MFETGAVNNIGIGSGEHPAQAGRQRGRSHPGAAIGDKITLMSQPLVGVEPETNAGQVGRVGRLPSLDAFRGATMAFMILVNNPGDGNNVYWPLQHAKWNGWTPY